MVGPLKAFSEEIRTIISNQFSIPFDNILIISTHTHSGPNVFLPLYLSGKDQIILSVEEVTGNLEAAEAHYSLSHIHGYYGNRNRKDGPYDDSFHAIRFKNTQGKVLGIFANISCHPTILKGNSLKFSSDFLGVVRKDLSEEWNAPVILTNGAAGDVSSRFFTKDNTYNTVIEVGKAISNQVLTNFKETPITLEDFKVKKIRLERDYSPKSDKELAGVNLLKNADISETILNEVKRKINFDNIHFELESYIYSIGPITIITFPGECVTGLANKIKSNSKSQVTMFVCYANDFWCYFVPDEEYGDYFESIISPFPKGLAEQYGQLISNEL